MDRLSPATLSRLPAGVKRPASARADGQDADGPLIVHFGLGAFARAYLAAFTAEANARTGSDWRIIGISLQRPDMRDALAPQAGLYTLVTRAPEGPEYAILDLVRGVLVAPEDPQAVIELLARPETRIVTLTITEKGYGQNPATGALDPAHSDIAHDLADPREPRSALGFILAGLARRRAAGLAPFTMLSCDNLPANGRVLRGLVLEFARRVAPDLGAPDLGEWIAREAAFPSSMVDRIVPATTPEDIAATAAALGFHDAAPVMAEPFRQWAIEDRFSLGRPAWEEAGAELVADVAPYEFMKLRMLNGAHSSLAYLGFLAGHGIVAEASADPLFAGFLDRLWAEIIPSVPPPPGVDLADYATRLLARFRNPGIRHRLAQIAMDGSQKLPQRLLGTLRFRLEGGLAAPALILGIAGFMRHATGRDEQGRAIEVQDPLRERLLAVARAAGGDARALVEGYLGIEAVFGADLARNEALKADLAHALHGLLAHGARETLAHFLNRPPNGKPDGHRSAS